MEATKPTKCQEGTFPCVLTWLSHGVSVCSAGIVSMTSKKSGLGLQTVSKHPHKASSHYHGSPTSGAQGYFYGSKTLTWAPPAAQNLPLPVPGKQYWRHTATGNSIPTPA